MTGGPAPAPAAFAATAARRVAGVALGAVTAVGEGLVLLMVLVPWAVAASAGRPPPRFVTVVTRRLTAVERWRLAVLLGAGDLSGHGDRRAMAYLAVRCLVGLLGGVVLFLLVSGAAVSAWAVVSWLGGGAPDGIPASWPVVTYLLAAAAVMAFLVVTGLAAVVRAEREVARRFLGPDAWELMRRRIAELAASRAGIVEAVDVERRRIERDLHDGLQQRLVALAMLLGRARHNESAELVADAHEESRRALAELQEVAWRVYPAMLDGLGLEDALAAVAERSTIPVRVTVSLPSRPAPSVETAAYFTVREAVTNAAKHSGAASVEVTVAERDGVLVVRVTDDGDGGADPGGRGLAGLRRRVAALDGRFAVSSPSGGPTVIEAELPCG